MKQGLDTVTSNQGEFKTDLQPLFGREWSVGSTAAQREIFSAALTDPDASLGYNQSISIFLEGALDHDALYSALLNLLDRHEALRGRFSSDGTLFLVRERVGLELPVLDLTALPEAERQSRYQAWVQDELNHVFDLINGPLFRATLVRMDTRRSVLVLNCHHAVVDGWSLKIMLDDLPKLYSALVQGKSHADLEPAASFTGYLITAAAREREFGSAVREFWCNEYQDGVPILELPLDHARPRFRSYCSKRLDHKVNRATYQALKAIGARGGVSQFVSLLSAFALYLHRITGQADLVVGVPAAGQIKSGMARLLGHDARLMPVRCTLQEGDTFAAYARRVMDRFLAAYENQWITVPELIHELKVPVDASRVPFVSVMFDFDPGLRSEEFVFDGLNAHYFYNHRNAETFEICINSAVRGEDLVFECAYSSTLFDTDAMQQRMEQLEQLMASINEQPDLPVAQLSVLPPAQIRAMDAALNATAMEYERGLCVDHLIEQMVRVWPDHPAVQSPGESVTYRELWEKSGRIASAILGLQLGPRPLVGVMLDRTAAMAAVLLGVWRAGGAFVPLDPAYPGDRLQYMVDHSSIRLVLTQGELIGAPQLERVQCMDVDAILSGGSAEPRVAGRSPEDLAYVIYTSGSTGQPKGVQVPHRALNNFLRTMATQQPGMKSGDRVLAVTTLSFDIAELELWLPLTTGATSFVIDRGTAIDGHALSALLRDQHINFVQATPATWRVLLFSGWEGDPGLTALCGGEALPRDLADELLQRVGVLWNVYGPTETTVWSTIDRVSAGVVTIGKPIGNTQAYVLDPYDQWVPAGTVGELWLGGDGVTVGYLGRDDLTRERYKDNPFTRRGRMYKTGDLVRIRRDGRIEYVGRNDFQVKVRGFRIELPEVQHALAHHPAIRQCVVVVKEKAPGDAHLVAYYTLKQGLNADVQALKNAMRAAVPEYMVPGIFVPLETLPLTQNGKIDVKALPDAFARPAAEAGHPELLRMEGVLATHPALRCVAVLEAGGDPDQRPVAMVELNPAADFNLVFLRKHLKGRFAEALIPGRIDVLPQLPLLTQGAIDRPALAALASGALSASDTADDQPRSAGEQLLAGVWSSMLGVTKVRMQDNFFNLGGNSLQSIQMIARVEKQVGVRLNPRHVLLNSLEQLATALPEPRQSRAS